MSNTLITARTLKGFADLLPSAARHHAHLVETVSAVYESFGFAPIRTPAIEYAEVLTGKGGGENDKQMFAFEDQGGRQVGLRFDLTVPLARYIALHTSNLNFPMRAYQVGTVWRGDRPQRGRYREFVQCDADILGAPGKLSDAEIMSVATLALSEIGLDTAYVRMNHRTLVNAVLAGSGVPQDLWIPALRALDRLDKVDQETVAEELRTHGVSANAVASLLAFARSRDGNTTETLSEIERDFGSLAGVAEALSEVQETTELVAAMTGSTERLVFDPRVMRGLDYYTGAVYEVALSDVPEVGSIGGGGRYDDLSGMFMKQPIPGVGGTLGVTRILAALELRRDLDPTFRPRPLVAIAVPDRGSPVTAAEVAADLRQGRHFDVALYPQQAKHSQQMRWADGDGAVVAVTVDGPDQLSVKHMEDGRRFSTTRNDIAKVVTALLTEGEPT